MHLRERRDRLADGCTRPAEATTKGMNLTCTLTPGDGEDAGAPSTSSSAPVMNSLPTSPEVALSPVEAAVGTLLTCEVTGASSDLDQDTLTYETTWYVNGFANPGTSSASVIAGTLVRDSEGTLAGGGDQIFCRVVANDNAGGLSNPADSQVIALLNSPPYGGAVIISPPTGTESDILLRRYRAVDPDLGALELPVVPRGRSRRARADHRRQWPRAHRRLFLTEETS